MLVIFHDHQLPKETDVCVRQRETGVMVRSRLELFETLGILGKAKMVLMGYANTDTVLLVKHEKPVAPSVEINYQNQVVYLKTTVEVDETRALVEQAIEMIKDLV